MDAFRLDNEVALITGGGTGLGLAMAQRMAEAGARVVLAGRRESVLREAAQTMGAEAHVEVHDVTQFDQAPKLVARITMQVGPPTILVNNAGVHLKKPAIETTEQEFTSVLDTHLTGAHALTRAVAPGMIKRRHGSILFIASMASFMGMPKIIAYTVAKTAVVGAVRALASEFSPHGVRVNAIAPGWIESDMLRQALASDPQREAKVLGRTLMNRFGEPDDIGHAAVYLCSPAARFVTGAVLPVDGGASIGF